MNQRTILPCIITVAVLLATAFLPLDAATYYVDANHPSASDSNPGTIDLPWLTIQHAAGTLVAGDTVYIRSGVYNENVHPEQSGNASAHIVYTAYPGETPILDGTGVTTSQNGINLDRSYVKLLGLEIRNWNGNGIWMEGAAYIEISDCELHHVDYGIGAGDGTHDIVLNRVRMHHFLLYGFDASPAGGADCYNVTLNDCVAYTGSDPGQNVDGFAIGHGDQHDFTFNRCEAYDVFDGFDVGEDMGGEPNNIVLNRCSGHDCWNDGFKVTGQATIVNCLSYRNQNANMGLYWGTAAGTTTLHSCTFMDAGAFNVWIENSVDSLRMYNCIVAGGDNIGLSFEQRNAGSYRGDYNIFHNDDTTRLVLVGYEDEFGVSQVASGAWTTFSGQDAHSLVSVANTDIFVDPVQFDLHLMKGSIAIDKGTSAGAPSEDFDGLPRPAGQGFDIGAHEYRTPDDVDQELADQRYPNRIHLAQNYPNPFSVDGSAISRNPTTTIQFAVPAGSIVELTIHDLLGRKVRAWTRGTHTGGIGSITWDGRDSRGLTVAAGIYIYTLRAGNEVYSRRMMITR